MNGPVPCVSDCTSPFDRSRLPTLDGLRFLALTQVVLYHGGLSGVPGDGVTFFFVLSGFLFAWLLEREYARTGTVSLRAFYRRRALRILPACYVAIVVTIAGIHLLGRPVAYGHALSAALFSANYYNAFHDHPPTGFSSYWSLGVEEQFYLVWPLLFLWMRRRGRRALMLFLAASVLVVSSWRSWLCLHEDVGTAYVYNAFETRFDSLAIGCLTGLLAGSRRVRAAVAKTCATPLAPLAVLAAMTACEHLGDDWHFSAGLTVDSLFVAVLLLQLIHLGDHRYWSWLDSRVMVWLGALSYSGYLYHHWGLAVGHRLPFASPVLQAIAGLVATVVLAALSYWAVERPFLRLKARAGHGGRGRPVAGDAVTSGLDVKPQPEAALTPAIASVGR